MLNSERIETELKEQQKKIKIQLGLKVFMFFSSEIKGGSSFEGREVRLVKRVSLRTKEAEFMPVIYVFEYNIKRCGSS